MQEFFITLLLTNLSALVKADADEEIKNKSRPKNKFNYQANRTFIIGRIRTLFIKLVVGISEMSDRGGCALRPQEAEHRIKPSLPSRLPPDDIAAGT